jgi:hypothetical protein
MPRAKGWNDLPAYVRAAWPDKELKKFDLTRDELAQSYIKEQETGQ